MAAITSGSLEGVEGPRHATRRFICQNIVSPFVLPDIYRHTEHVDQALLSRGATRDPRDRESETACRGTKVCVSRSNLNVLLRREGTERAKDAYIYMYICTANALERTRKSSFLYLNIFYPRRH